MSERFDRLFEIDVIIIIYKYRYSDTIKVIIYFLYGKQVLFYLILNESVKNGIHNS